MKQRHRKRHNQYLQHRRILCRDVFELPPQPHDQRSRHRKRPKPVGVLMIGGRMLGRATFLAIAARTGTELKLGFDPDGSYKRALNKWRELHPPPDVTMTISDYVDTEGLRLALGD